MLSHLWAVYSHSGCEFERGSGCWLYTSNGDSYLDFTSGVAVNSLGHCHPALVEVLSAQGRKLWHLSNLFPVPEQEIFASRLCDLTFADKVIFLNSGSEAVECALKLARRYFFSKGQPERHRVITFEGGFHGRTFAALAASGRKSHLEGFSPQMPGFDQVVFSDPSAVSAAIGPDMAAILIEPIQGEGGVRLAPPAFLRALRSLADEHDLLLIFDEVQCGMGRTGKLFAHEWSGIFPDIMAVAKGIGGGFPLSACLAVSSVADAMTVGSHGSTYGGNPLAMAVGKAVLDIVSDSDFLATVMARADQLRYGLSALAERRSDLIEGVCGLGLMLGLKCRIPPSDLLRELFKEKLLALSAGVDIVRLLPPLVVSESEIDQALARLDRACVHLLPKRSGE
ncbi:MAG: aspartate aminotransferase family protein [Alphaproteobacteria bacterium]|nr:aspartate aminotransferase family protein [Alphaproteobacteria bacterium]